MARTFPSNIDRHPEGSLLIEEVHPGFNEVYFVPPVEKLEEARIDFDDPVDFKKLLLEVNVQDDYISMHPLNTLATHSSFLEPKYDKLRIITLVGFLWEEIESEDDVVGLLETLPSGFVQDFNYGLGLQKDYRFIVSNLEKLDVTHLVIEKGVDAAISEKDQMLTIGFSEFDKIRKEINRITHNARSISSKVKMAASYNLFAHFLGNENYPQKPMEVDDGVLSRVIARSSTATSVKLSDSEKVGLLKAVKENTQELAGQDSNALVKLQNDIELVTLAELIEKYKSMLSKKMPEDKWQVFFSENPFVLNMAFGYPVVKIQDQASIGGRKLSGSGDKITDFLVKNSTTNNTAIFEIKTPQTKLLNKTAYRDGVYTPSKEVSGAVNQVLDQKYKFQKEISNLKDNSGIYDIESYAVHCALIIGVAPSDKDHQKSFELFRRNSKDVEIITFDELLGKLILLHEFLSEDSGEG